MGCGRKTLTIGVTVNLEHYENLRLEVSGDAETIGDAEELSQFLDTVLAGFGKNDPATAERILSYRRRVLPASRGGAGERDATVEVTPAGQGIPPEEPGAPPVASPAGPTAAETPREPTAAPGITCTVCGSPVTPSEQKMSQLFTSRTLCRACMKNL